MSGRCCLGQDDGNGIWRAASQHPVISEVAVTGSRCDSARHPSWTDQTEGERFPIKGCAERPDMRGPNTRPFLTQNETDRSAVTCARAGRRPITLRDLAGPVAADPCGRRPERGPDDWRRFGHAGKVHTGVVGHRALRSFDELVALFEGSARWPSHLRHHAAADQTFGIRTPRRRTLTSREQSDQGGRRSMLGVTGADPGCVRWLKTACGVACESMPCRDPFFLPVCPGLDGARLITVR
jgi:hypothetical protein